MFVKLCLCEFETNILSYSRFKDAPQEVYFVPIVASSDFNKLNLKYS